MLTIRMQRRGRSGHAQFRVVIQDSRFSPSSGRVVAYVGNWDPHSKAATLDSEKISAYLDKGAQPSDRVARLLAKEGIKLPEWYKLPPPKKKEVRNPDKRRSTRPEGAPAPSPTQTSTNEVSAGKPKAAAPVEEAPAEEPIAEAETSVEVPGTDEVAPEPGKASEPAAEPVESPEAAEEKPIE